VRLGAQGPELYFTLDEPASLQLNQTTVISEDLISPALPPPESGTYETMLTEGVERARQARTGGVHGQTMTIMREALHRALRHSGRRFRRALAILAAALLLLSGYAAWQAVELNRQRIAINRRIGELEAQLQRSAGAEEADRLATQLESYEVAGSRLQRNVLYRIVQPHQDFVMDGIRGILAEFGSEVYSVPPEFSERVEYYIRQYQGTDRPNMTRALGSAAGQISVIRGIMEEEHLPGDLAYLTVVESALGTGESAAGAVGLWQFTAATARAYGLHVADGVDERTNVSKATYAACRLLRQLILEFGSGTSTMLAIAAYNSGPAKVRQAVQKTVQDPIKQRNFWYLYHVNALPQETREYVPKVIAAVIIGRNPGLFGFNSAQDVNDNRKGFAE